MSWNSERNLLSMDEEQGVLSGEPRSTPSKFRLSKKIWLPIAITFVGVLGVASVVHSSSEAKFDAYERFNQMQGHLVSFAQVITAAATEYEDVSGETSLTINEKGSYWNNRMGLSVALRQQYSATPTALVVRLVAKDGKLDDLLSTLADEKNEFIHKVSTNHPDPPPAAGAPPPTGLSSTATMVSSLINIYAKDTQKEGTLTKNVGNIAVLNISLPMFTIPTPDDLKKLLSKNYPYLVGSVGFGRSFEDMVRTQIADKASTEAAWITLPRGIQLTVSAALSKWGLVMFKDNLGLPESALALVDSFSANEVIGYKSEELLNTAAKSLCPTCAVSLDDMKRAFQSSRPDLFGGSEDFSYIKTFRAKIDTYQQQVHSIDSASLQGLPENFEIHCSMYNVNPVPLIQYMLSPLTFSVLHSTPAPPAPVAPPR
jgi:hypothetical protein